MGPYGATKFAVRGFTEAAAKEWAQYGIRVNGMRNFIGRCLRKVVNPVPDLPLLVAAYGPGIVDTPMWDHIDRELARIVSGAKNTNMFVLRTHVSSYTQENISVGEAKARRVKNDIKLGRIQEPEDVAKLVSFLVSDEGEYITGQTIKTCGGASL